MATRRFSINPGDSLEAVVEAAGAATATKSIELTVDQATTIVTDQGATRAVKRGEIQVALRILEEAILKSLNLSQ